MSCTGSAIRFTQSAAATIRHLSTTHSAITSGRSASRSSRRFGACCARNCRARAMFEVAELWNRVNEEGTRNDGSDQDLERGPEDERIVAGERVQTWEDKVFGGRAVTVLRKQ